MSHNPEEKQSNLDSNHKNESSSNKRIKFKTWQFILLLLGVVIITAGITVAATIGISHKISGLTKDERQEIKKIEYAYKTLNNDYYKKQNAGKLSEAAIDGMVKELKDPYSEYMTKDETKSFNEDVSGDFVGVGAEMQKKDKQIMITSPMKDSPAEKAGIQEKEIKIKRGKIHVKSVEYKKKDNIGVFNINKFQDNTADELKSAIIKAHKDGVRSIVLDLRNNPGGLLDEAVKMANIFIDKDQTVVKLEKGDDTESIKTSNDASNEAKDMKVSILVNEGSASASEVFTGAMRDHKKAKVYGSKTFGKGIVQTTREFKDGSLLKYTQMKWLTPDGHYIHGKGIQPDTKIASPKYQSISVIPTDKSYSVGDNTKYVKSIKIGLDALGYNVNNDSKQFDTQLESAIKKFQSEHELSVNGKFDKKTNEKFTQLLVEKANKEDKVLDELINKLK